MDDSKICFSNQVTTQYEQLRYPWLISIIYMFQYPLKLKKYWFIWKNEIPIFFQRYRFYLWNQIWRIPAVKSLETVWVILSCNKTYRIRFQYFVRVVNRVDRQNIFFLKQFWLFLKSFSINNSSVRQERRIIKDYDRLYRQAKVIIVWMKKNILERTSELLITTYGWKSRNQDDWRLWTDENYIKLY